MRLDPSERDAVREFARELRDLLQSESPASDPGLARLFPPAYPDDPLRNLEFEQAAGNTLLEGRLASVEIVESTVDAETLTEHQLLAWLAVLNGLRLVLGIRLQITEETTEADFQGDEERIGLYFLYGYLTWLESEVVKALPVN